MFVEDSMLLGIEMRNDSHISVNEYLTIKSNAKTKALHST